MTAKALFELSRVTLRLGDKLLFPDTSWTFGGSQNWLMVGANGSGKTILARAIAGEVPVVQGEILYGISPQPGKLPEDSIRLVSFEHQKAAAGDIPVALRWFSAEQESAIPVSRFLSQEMVEEINPFEVRARREQSPAAFRLYRQELLEQMQLRPLLRRSMLSLSNGEMRKVLIARALLRKPRLLILDDAFAGLDSDYRVHLKHILEGLMRKGTRMLLIDSLLYEIPEGISHILAVDKGRIAAQGPYRRMMAMPRVRKLLMRDTPAVRKRNPPVRHRKTGKASEELVRLENVHVRYNGRDILAGVHWIIRRGESWALTGPNGSGKSTLLSLISGDNPQAYANSVVLFGRRRGSGEAIWDIKRRIGVISSELHLHFPEDQTCLETVLSGFRDTLTCFKRGTPAQRAAAQNILERFGLAAHSKSRFHSLSTGAQRMVLLARALVKNPDLLLLDEPCQGLDLEHRTTFLKTVDALIRGSKTTVVYVTHRLDEIPKSIHLTLCLTGVVPTYPQTAGGSRSINA